MKAIDRKEIFHKKAKGKKLRTEYRRYAKRDRNRVKDEKEEEEKKTVKDTFEPAKRTASRASQSLRKLIDQRIRNTERYSNYRVCNNVTPQNDAKPKPPAAPAKEMGKQEAAKAAAAQSSAATTVSGGTLIIVAGIAVVTIAVVLLIIGAYTFLMGLISSIGANQITKDTYSMAEVCRIYKNAYWGTIAEESRGLIEDNGDGFTFPIVMNAEIPWDRVIMLYYAYISDKVIADPDNKLNADSEDISYFDDVFWAVNKVAEDERESFELNENSVMLGFTGPNGEVASIDITKGAVVACYHPTAEAVFRELNFTEQEKESYYTYLATAEFREAVSHIVKLIDFGSGQRVVDTAIGETGNDLTKYCRWYGYETEWCAIFVSWCADQNGYIEGGIMPKTASVPQVYRWFTEERNPGYFIYTYDYAIAPGSIEPQPGWLVIYERDDNHNTLNHIGIVESYDRETNTLQTIEGNSGQGANKYERKVVHYERRPWNRQIWGFCVPAYPNTNDNDLQDFYNNRVFNVSTEYVPFQTNDEDLRTLWQNEEIIPQHIRQSIQTRTEALEH